MSVEVVWISLCIPNVDIPSPLAYTELANLPSTGSRHCRPVTLSANAATNLPGACGPVISSGHLYGSSEVSACMVHGTVGSVNIQLIDFPLNGSVLPHPAYC